MLSIPSIFCLFCCVFVEGVSNKSNNGTTDVSNCQVYYSNSNYFQDFFDFTAVEDASGNTNYNFDFHFAVSAAPIDVHILLALSSNMKNGDPAYEILIGDGTNKISGIIRCGIKYDWKVTVTDGLVSASHLNLFWIHLTDDGAILLGKEGEERPLMSWTDPDFLPVKVFSFATHDDRGVKWYFNCSKTDSTKINKDSTEVNKDSVEINKDPTEVNKDSAEVNKDSEEVNKDSTEVNKDSVEINKDPTEVNKDSAEVNKDSTEVNKDSTEVNKDSVEINKDPTEVNKDSAEVNKDSVEVNKDSTEVNRANNFNGDATHFPILLILCTCYWNLHQ